MGGRWHLLPTSEASSPANRLITIPDGLPRLTLGWDVAVWASTYLRHPNGVRAGKPWEFIPSQVRFLVHWYAVDEDGRWLYHHGVRRLPKGSGKSPFAALMALAELCGPVRVHDLDVKAGVVVGKQVDMPLVQIAATAESQTANTMRMVRAFAPKGSQVVRDHALDPGKVKYYRAPEGTLEVITASETAAEGAESTFVVADETEHWRPSNGGPALMATLVDNLTKSGSRLMETCNAWEPGRETVAESSYEAWLAQEEHRTKARMRILYDARIAPPETELDDEQSLRSALQFVYDDCWWQDLEPIIGRVWDIRARPDDSRRKYLNQPTAAVDAWVTPQEWAALARPEVVVADGEPVVLFFDGSKSGDATALIGCRLEDGHVFTPGVWEVDNTAHESGITVDASDVDRVVSQTFDRYNVVAFFADVREWESFALTEWPRRHGPSLKLWAAPNARPPQAVAWDMRGHSYEFAKAVEACHADIVTKSFTHDGHSAVSRHVANARRKPYRDAVTIGKSSPHSPRKIDAAVAVVGARMVRRMVLGSNTRYRKGGNREKRRVVVM